MSGNKGCIECKSPYVFNTYTKEGHDFEYICVQDPNPSVNEYKVAHNGGNVYCKHIIGGE